MDGCEEGWECAFALQCVHLQYVYLLAGEDSGVLSEISSIHECKNAGCGTTTEEDSSEDESSEDEVQSIKRRKKADEDSDDEDDGHRSTGCG